MTGRDGRVLIAGGGIGGLAAAISLDLRKQPVTVLEQSSFGDETGAGIQLGPNATRALRDLGVLAAIEAVSFKPEAIWLFDGLSGQRLATVPLGAQAETRYGAPYLTLHRADLHAALLSAAQASDLIELRPGFEVTTIRQSKEHVTVDSADGGTVEGEALVGADGLWSVVRTLIAPQARLRFTGATASRTPLPRDGLPSPFDQPIVGLWLGPRAHLVHYPVRSGKELNLVAVTEGGPEQQGWNQAGDQAALLASFAGWCDEAQALLQQASGWRSWSLYRPPALIRWSEDRLTLLGDAAHPIMPYLAQGAALAIEDAVALGGTVAAHPSDLPSAFSRYATLRQPRALSVQRRSRVYGRLYHLSGPLRSLRNVLLQRRHETKALARLDWLYGFRLPRG